MGTSSIHRSPTLSEGEHTDSFLEQRLAVSDYGDSRDTIHDMQYFCEISSDEARKALLKAILKTCY